MLAKGAGATRHISQSVCCHRHLLFPKAGSLPKFLYTVRVIKFLVVYSCECETCLVGLGKGGRNKAAAAADTARGGGFELGSLGVRGKVFLASRLLRLERNLRYFNLTGLTLTRGIPRVDGAVVDACCYKLWHQVVSMVDKENIPALFLMGTPEFFSSATIETT